VRLIKKPVLVLGVCCLALLVLPTSAFAVGTMSGQVFYDPPAGANVPIQGVQVLLRTSTDAPVTSDTTDASGNYSFSAFANGSFEYIVRLSTPLAFSPIAPVSGERTGIKPVDGATTSGLNFSVKGATVKGLVFHDRNGDGVKNGSDTNLNGATVNVVGSVTKNLTSAADGTFTTGSPVLPAGSYTVTASKTNYDLITPARIANPAVGAEVTVQNSGLKFATGTVEGDVYVEANGTPGRQVGELPIAGSAITVSGTYDSEPFTLNTTSGADGTFSVPGVFVGASRTIAAAQPSTYADGAEFTTVGGATPGADQFTTVTVTKNTATGRFQFGETGATITGLTFADYDADGQRDAGEPTLGDRSIAVAATGFSQSVTSGADGVFSVAGLPGGVDVTLTPKTTSEATAPLAKIVQPPVGGTIGNVLFGYLGLTPISDLPKPGDESSTPAKEVKIVAGKRTIVNKKSRLSLTCALDRGVVKKCDFKILTKRKKGKVLAKGIATSKGSGTSLKVTLKLTKLGKAKLKGRAPKPLSGIASVSALDATGKTLTATKAVQLRAAGAAPKASR
jgi:hypothetical protein